MKLFNIGFDRTNGVKIGLIVKASTMDHAIARGRAWCEANEIEIRHGDTAQVRDPVQASEWFDRVYPLLMRLD